MNNIINNLSIMDKSTQTELTILLIVIVLIILAIIVLTIIKKFKDK